MVGIKKNQTAALRNGVPLYRIGDSPYASEFEKEVVFGGKVGYNKRDEM